MHIFLGNIYNYTWSEKLWGFQATCNPCQNYVHVTGYPVLHGDLLHFLQGKNLQCRIKRKIFLWLSWFPAKNNPPQSVFLPFWNDIWQNLPKWRLAVLQYALPVLNKTGFDEFKRNLILGYTCVRPPDLLVHFCTSYRASDLRHKKFFYSMYQNALILMPNDF